MNKYKVGDCIHANDGSNKYDTVYYLVTGIHPKYPNSYSCVEYNKITRLQTGGTISSFHIDSVMGRKYVKYQATILSKKVYIA